MKPSELVMIAVLYGLVAGGGLANPPVPETREFGKGIISEVAENKKELQPILLEAAGFLDRGEWA